MNITVHKGILKELGAAVGSVSDQSASIKYTYIEFENGELLKSVDIAAGLDSKLAGALSSKQPVELHVHLMKRLSHIVALKTSDGRLYATDPGKASKTIMCIAVFAALWGVLLIPFYGSGLIILFVAWQLWKIIRMDRSLRRYIVALPNVILL